MKPLDETWADILNYVSVVFISFRIEIAMPIHSNPLKQLNWIWFDLICHKGWETFFFCSQRAIATFIDSPNEIELFSVAFNLLWKRLTLFLIQKPQQNQIDYCHTNWLKSRERKKERMNELYRENFEIGQLNTGNSSQNRTDHNIKWKKNANSNDKPNATNDSL